MRGVGLRVARCGYRFVDDESYRKEEPVEKGDEACKRVWPRAIWPSTTPARIPLSLIGRFLAEVDLDGSRDESVSFLLPDDGQSANFRL